MDAHTLKIAGAVGGVGLIAVIFIRKRAAASAAAASSTDTGSAGTSYYASGLDSVSTGVSTGGAYAVDASGASSGYTDPSLDSASSVASFGSLLQGILSSGAQANAAAQSNLAANNAQAAASINSIATQSAPSQPAAQPKVTDRNLVERVGNYLVANTGLYATDTTYRAAWDNVAQANQRAAGTGWNYVSDSSAQGNMSQLAVELSDAINPNWRTQQAVQ